MSLACGLVRWGARRGTGGVQVTLVTSTLAGSVDDSGLPFRVVRRPNLLMLVRLLKEADVIHLAGPGFLPALFALLSRKPVIVEHHGFQTICPNGQLFQEPTQTPCPGHFMAGRHRECIRCNAKSGLVRSIALWFLTFPRRWLCTRAKANIMPTNWLGGLLQLPRSTTVHHGLSSDNIRRLSSTVAVCPTFAFVGRLVRAKGVQILLQAAGRLRA